MVEIVEWYPPFSFMLNVISAVSGKKMNAANNKLGIWVEFNLRQISTRFFSRLNCSKHLLSLDRT